MLPRSSQVLSQSPAATNPSSRAQHRDVTPTSTLSSPIRTAAVDRSERPSINTSPDGSEVLAAHLQPGNDALAVSGKRCACGRQLP